MMVSLHRMVEESTWSAVMTLLAQARIEASDAASAPPLVMVKREQVIDILGLLEPFQEALQVIVFFGIIDPGILLLSFDIILALNHVFSWRRNLHFIFGISKHQPEIELCIMGLRIDLFGDR